MFCCCAAEDIEVQHVAVVSTLSVAEVVGDDEAQDEEDRGSAERRPEIIKIISRRETVVATEQLMSFGGQAHLLRGSRLTKVMQRGAAIYASPAGSAATYSLSKPVETIAAFISHNWTVSRWKKFFCLALHYNLFQATLIAFCALIAIAAGTYQRFLPRVALEKGKNEPGICAALLYVPVFWLVACFGQEARRLASCCDPTVFLDKTCIHQTDSALQRDGIKRLGAFIKASSKMVIIFTDVYLKKLWTVYEVACFLSLHPTSSLVVVTPAMPLFVFGGALIAYCERSVFVLGQLVGFRNMDLWLVLASLFALSGFLLLLRHLARLRAGARQQLVNFRVQDCICAVEADRSLVYGNIALLMRAKGEIRIDATEDEALDAFNLLVRKKLRGPLVAALHLSYFQIVAVALCSTVWLVDLIFGITPWPGVHQRVCSLLGYSTTTFGIIPLSILLFSKLCGQCLHLSGGAEWLYRLLCLLIMIVSFTGSAAVAYNQVWYACVDPDIGLVTAAIPFGLALLTAALFAYERRPSSEDIEDPEVVARRTAEVDESEDIEDAEVVAQRTAEVDESEAAEVGGAGAGPGGTGCMQRRPVGEVSAM